MMYLVHVVLPKYQILPFFCLLVCPLEINPIEIQTPSSPCDASQLKRKTPVVTPGQQTMT